VSRQVSFGRRLSMLAAAADPTDVAVVVAAAGGAESALTWRELEARANQCGRLLTDQGLGIGDLVVVALPASLEHLVVSFGCWKAGASVLPLRYDLPVWERDRLLQLASASAVVAEHPFPGHRCYTPAELLDAASALDDSPVTDRIPVPKRVIASSGSTGRPKLIVAPEPGLIDSGDEQLPNGARRVQLGASPLYHTNGWMGGGPGAVLNGNRTILMERFDAARAVDLIERHAVNIAIMVPTMLMRIARLPEVASSQFASIEELICGGSSVPEWVVRAWLELIAPDRLFLSYGGSEGLGSVRVRGDEWVSRPGTTGRPQSCDVQILDADGNVLPVGSLGEIYLRPHRQGPSFQYLGAPTPEPTSQGFRTLGDLGWMDADGYLYIADRRQDLVVTGGANVFPAEVEAALSEHPAVADQVVIGLDDPEWGRRVHAVVQLAAGKETVSSDELRAFCRERLAPYKVPKTFEFVPLIERSEAGKLNRTALAEQRNRRTTAV
jgi:bile acid-coenzyme A ligase